MVSPALLPPSTRYNQALKYFQKKLLSLLVPFSSMPPFNRTLFIIIIIFFFF